MAIQQINLGSAPAGTGGDTQRAANTKINENFSNTAHAASRLVGLGDGNLVEFSNTDGVAKSGLGSKSLSSSPVQYAVVDTTGFRGFSPTIVDIGQNFSVGYVLAWNTSDRYGLVHQRYGAELYFCHWGVAGDNAAIKAKRKIYHDGNTTKDTATGFLKASSPVLHVYNDSITKIHEAEQLDITVDKKGVGHYEIHGTTGLRKDDGWFMSPPRDVHGNVLCMVDLDEKDGVVILKTYKKKFDFETVSIVHDFDNPMDIPEGVCVEFRFNDLPQEQLDEPVE